MDPLVLEKITHHFSKYPVRTYAKGQTLIEANQEPLGVSFLEAGIVEQYDITPEGNRITVNTFQPPAFFPMSWAVNKTPNQYFYTALSTVSLRHADANETVAFLRANPDVLFDLLSRVYKGTDALLRRQVITASGIASSRLVYELLLEAYRFGTEIDAATRMITTRHSTLAARSGLARETVSRELHKLENEGLITLSKSGIGINTAYLEKKLNIQI